ncbi:MAG TPA: hypothetical protein VFL91_27880 [Thermomicrobiales bacterium]|nr:hypothetical protein [Thermomicrobiales bacterium]
METAESTIEIPLSVEDAHGAWLAFTGQATARSAVTGERTQEAVPAEQLPGGAADGDKGTIYFNGLGPDRTRVTMQLRYNPRALADVGRDHAWITRRIEMYLERYRAASGSPQSAPAHAASAAHPG